MERSNEFYHNVSKGVNRHAVSKSTTLIKVDCYSKTKDISLIELIRYCSLHTIASSHSYLPRHNTQAGLGCTEAVLAAATQ